MRGLVVCAVVGQLVAGEVRAYEPDTTLAGLTQRAALASRLHRKLLDGFGLSLGIFEPLRLRLDRMPGDEGKVLRVRLLGLDPAEGYAPERKPGENDNEGGRQAALGWLSAGTVLESLPASRIANHFLDLQGQGLHPARGQSVARMEVRALGAGLASARQLLTATAFDGRGMPATAWIESVENELGLPVFLRAYERAVIGESAEERETALVQMLMAAGAVIGVVEQMGDPAYVRNDLGTLLDEGGPYEQYVSRRHGRAGLIGSSASASTSTSTITELMKELGGYTAQHFFSSGSLPGRYGEGLPAGVSGRPEERPAQDRGYVHAPWAKHLVAWFRLRGGGVKWALDDRCLADYAAALLPETARAAQRAMDLLFRGEMRMEIAEDQIKVWGLDAQGVGPGTLVLLAEGEDGKRRVLQTVTVSAQSGPAVLATLPLPSPARRVAALYRGSDPQGRPLLIAAQIALP